MKTGSKRVYRRIFGLLVVFIFSFSLLIYFFHLDLKKTLVEKISDRATSLIGQPVEIGNLSFSPSAGINLYNISIKNPKDFKPGELLLVKRLYLDIELRNLLKGTFHFKNIVAYAPEITLMKNKNGRLNVSNTFVHLLSKKTAVRYQIEKFAIESGLFSFNRDKRYKVNNVNLILKCLSSDLGARTMIESSASYEGNRIQIDGWVHLQDKPMKANISLSCRDFSLAAFREPLEQYKIDTERTRLNFSLTSGGDTEKGFHIKTDADIKRTGFLLLARDMKEIHLHTDAFLNLRENSITINTLSLNVDDFSSALLKGTIADIGKNLSYRLEIKVTKLDLSVFHFIKGLTLNGMITSNTIKVAGKLSETAPEISGTLYLKDGDVTSPHAIVKNIDAHILFSPAHKILLKAETSGKILKLGENFFSKPLDVKVLTNMQGTPQRLQLQSFADLSPFEVNVKNGKDVFVARSNLRIEGIFNGTVFYVRNSFETKGINYAGHVIPDFRFQSNSAIDLQKNEITFKNLKFETKNMTSSASHIKVSLQENKTRYKTEIKDINVSYPEQRAELKQGDLYLNLHREEKAITGDFIFSVAKIMFEDISSGMVSGSGRFDEKHFSVDIPQAEISGGRIKLTTEGRTSANVFPIKIHAAAEGIDLNGILKPVLNSMKIPYSISGNIKSAVFKGIVDSQESLHGNAFAEIIKISAVNKDTGQNFLKDAFLSTEISFEGKDFTLKTDIEMGKISIKTSGAVKNFTERDRQARIRAIIPEAKATDMRTSLWDAFPDTLLYVGLNGSISSEVVVDYRNSELEVNGELTLKDLTLEGEYGEYWVGPVNGTIPIAYGKTEIDQQTPPIPSFDKSQFEVLTKYYTQKNAEEGFHKLTIGSLSYGFKLLENIYVLVKQEGGCLNIRHFSANMFDGMFFGSASLNISDDSKFKAGFLVKDLSLIRVCEEIEPIRGYLSGKVDGVATLSGSLHGISQLMGKADFWTCSTRNEKTKISKEFLQKIGGPSLKTYLGDRRFNKGIMSLYLQNGYLTFRELEISNRNLFGITDLSIKVTPFNNRIAVDHLLWTMIEAAERTKEK